MIRAEKEVALIPGGFATPEAVAHIITQKFIMGSPLYRQEQEWKNQGIELSRQTMSNWMLKCVELYLEPLYEKLHEKLLKRDVLHADETTIRFLRSLTSLHPAKAICGFTGPAVMLSMQLCYTITSQVEAKSILRNS